MVLVRICLEIALKTRCESILQEARSIAIAFLVRIIGRNDLESRYEAACWFDGLQNEFLNEFCQLLQDANKVTSPFALEMVKAWDKMKLPPPVPHIRISALLRQSLRSLAQFTQPFQRFLAQIMTRCLWSHGNPIPLGVMIVYAAELHAMDWQPFRPLVDYCRLLMYFDRYSTLERVPLVTRLIHWEQGSWVWLQCDSPTAVRSPRTYFNAQAPVLAQQVIQLEKVLPPGTLDLSNCVRKVLGIALVVRFEYISFLDTTDLSITYSFFKRLVAQNLYPRESFPSHLTLTLSGFHFSTMD